MLSSKTSSIHSIIKSATKRMPEIASHRGFSYGAENTRSAIKRALKAGFPVEFDVQEVEGFPVLMHDTTVNRTTDGTGEVRRFTYPKFRRLNAAHGTRFAPEPPPTLKEILDLVTKEKIIPPVAGPILNIDAKHELRPETFDLLDQDGLLSNGKIKFNSDIFSIVQATRHMLPDADVGFVVEEFHEIPSVRELKKARVTTLYPHVRLVSPGFVEYFHKAEIPVVAWFAGDQQEWNAAMVNTTEHVLWSGVQGVIVNHPEKTHALQQERLGLAA